MLLVLLDTGVRRTELVNLDLADLDLAGQRLRVLHGKGNKQRVVRFGTKARKALEDYLERFRGREPGPLFLSRYGTRMSSHSVLIFLRRPGRSGEGEGAPVSAHLCDLGDRERGQGAGRAAPVGAQHAGDGAAVLGDLRCGEGGAGP
jgi:site-specific recombinase XerD